jgi:Lar family restriction alleviation protein
MVCLTRLSGNRAASGRYHSGVAEMSLNACPFCGGKGLIDTERGPDRELVWFVICHSCGAKGPWDHQQGAATRLWNARYTRLQPAPVCGVCGHVAREESGLAPVLDGEIVSTGTARCATCARRT